MMKSEYLTGAYFSGAITAFGLLLTFGYLPGVESHIPPWAGAVAVLVVGIGYIHLFTTVSDIDENEEEEEA